MSDKVSANSVVTFSYRLFGEDGELIEQLPPDQPVTVLQGHANVVRGLDQVLLERSIGEQLSVVVAPADGYGARREDWTQRISKKCFDKPAKLRVGQETAFETEHGVRRVTIVKVGAKMVDADLNHPLAGRALNFEIEVVAIREAQKSEIEYGYAHGAGGHAH